MPKNFPIVIWGDSIKAAILLNTKQMKEIIGTKLVKLFRRIKTVSYLLANFNLFSERLFSSVSDVDVKCWLGF